MSGNNIKPWYYYAVITGFFSGLIFIAIDLGNTALIIWTCFCGLAILLGNFKK